MLILTINSGSSSIKFSIYRMETAETLIISGELEKIGKNEGFYQAKDAGGRKLIEKQIDLPDHEEALNVLFEWLKNNAYDRGLDAVGHRIVHGGARYLEPNPVTPDFLMELRRLVPFAPEHLPHEIEAIESTGHFLPGVRQVACFDTAFHRTMSGITRLYGLPRYLIEEGVQRYGFHGLSYEYIIAELFRIGGRDAGQGRIIIAHLGHGSSMAAVYRGQGIDTTMGFTPAGGLVMSTRSGDIDPGVILYLLRQKGLNADQVDEIVNRKGGLLGVSGASADMKDLLERERHDAKALEATTLFCYQAKKFLGGLAAALGGLDTLIFTGGIGENSPSIRLRICEGLEFLGVHIDKDLNSVNSPVISGDDSRVTVRVMKTNEELMIARHTYNLISRESL